MYNMNRLIFETSQHPMSVFTYWLTRSSDHRCVSFNIPMILFCISNMCDLFKPTSLFQHVSVFYFVKLIVLWFQFLVKYMKDLKVLTVKKNKCVHHGQFLELEKIHSEKTYLLCMFTLFFFCCLHLSLQQI